MFYGKPATIEDYMSSTMIVEPLRLFDCCVDTDGACAIVVTTAERARDLKQTPAIIMGATQGIAEQGEMMTSFYRPKISGLPEDPASDGSGRAGRSLHSTERSFYTLFPLNDVSGSITTQVRCIFIICLTGINNHHGKKVFVR